MGHIGISITKRVAFRDSTQEFTNVYHYASLNANPNAAEAEALIDEIVAWEQQIHATSVSFIRAKCWSAGGTVQQNRMIFQKNLTGTGAMTTGGYDKERAYLVQWSAGIDNRGRPVKLRKWFHTCGGFGGNVPVPTQAVLENNTAISTTLRNLISTEADKITRIGSLEAWGLVGPTGRERDGGPPTSHRYLEHHQLGDQWRS